MKKTQVVAAILAAVLAGPSHALVLNFNDLANPDPNNPAFVDPIHSGGYAVTTECGTVNCLAIWPSSSAFQADPGFAAVLNFFQGTPVSLFREDGLPFDFHSIDLEDGYNGGSSVTLNFTFDFDDGSSDTAQIILDTEVGLQTVLFDKLGVTKVTWTPVGNYAQFDNIEVTPVPEPQTYALMLAGLAFVGWVVRRRVAR